MEGTRISGAGQGPVVRISDPMAPKTGSVRISRDTRFSFFGDPKEYGASRMYKLYCITITSSIIVRVVNSNYKRREETYFNRVLHTTNFVHLFLRISSPIHTHIYIYRYTYIYPNRIFTLPYRPVHSTVSKTRSFFPLSLVSLFVERVRGRALYGT